MMKKGNKVVIVGAGYVGATTAFTLMHTGLIRELVLIDINEEKVEGEVADLRHGVSLGRPVDIKVGTKEDYRDADVIVMTAGPSMLPGQTRLDLAKTNAYVVKMVMEDISSMTKDAVIIFATNPVDVLTYMAYHYSDYPKEKLIGSGTVLDSSRLKSLLAQDFDMDARNIHSFVLGEHGDSAFAAWSLANVAGINVDEFWRHLSLDEINERKDHLIQQVRQGGYDVLKKKGATYYAVALAIRRIVEAILRDEQSTLTVSSVMNGSYGIEGVALSLPSIINRQGIQRVLHPPLNDEEVIKLRESSAKLRQTIESIIE